MTADGIDAQDISPRDHYMLVAAHCATLAANLNLTSFEVHTGDHTQHTQDSKQRVLFWFRGSANSGYMGVRTRIPWKAVVYQQVSQSVVSMWQ